MNIRVLSILLLIITGIPVVLQQLSENQKHYAVLNSFQTLDALNSEINDRLLRTYSGLDKNYDALSRISGEIEDQLAYLTRLKAQDDSDLSENFDRYNQANEVRNDLLENFKSHNSVLKNSRKYAPVAVEELLNKNRNDLSISLQAQLSELKIALLDYSLNGGQIAKINLKINLKDLKHVQDELPLLTQQDLSKVINHTRVILREQVLVQRYLQKTINANTGRILVDAIRDAQQAVEQIEHSIATAQTTLFIYLGFMLTFLLWIGAGFIGQKRPVSI